ncbi:hypothetical protein EDD86DRAFT_244880 [Gorgonomyces haynaldii]|nr:hypothetical protein EDD86DRAFT_244880 [Gorgonomyces haynaldii]
MSGFAQDVRPLCPSLVVQLIDVQDKKQVRIMDTLNLILRCELVQLESGTRTIVNDQGIDPNETLRLTNNLLGNCTQTAQLFTDIDGLFFVFPDLGVRSPGKYFFRLSLYCLEKGLLCILTQELHQAV